MKKWADIPGYEGLYRISQDGDVLSLKGLSGSIKKQHIDTKGYFVIDLYNGSTRKSFKVHRLIATCFIPNPNNKPCINHKNGIRNDNRLSNLEWCTYAENNLHAYTHLGRKAPTGGAIFGRTGAANGSSKPVLQIDQNGVIIKEWESANRCFVELGFRTGAISECCRGAGRRKTYKGFTWRFKK